MTMRARCLVYHRLRAKTGARRVITAMEAVLRYLVAYKLSVCNM